MLAQDRKQLVEHAVVFCDAHESKIGNLCVYKRNLWYSLNVSIETEHVSAIMSYGLQFLHLVHTQTLNPLEHQLNSKIH